ncbi:hypothetical protein CkP1_0240 [Citrobacter phage CkP1]|nr:hypothetical protein CkP1_0240 [Citrobacter phage CkP1]
MRKVFVKDASMLLKIKKTQLRKLMLQGSRYDTPLDKKPLFEYRVEHINGVNYVTWVECYTPGQYSSFEFELNEQTRVKYSDWYKIVEPVEDYNEWLEEIEEQEHLRSLIKNLENAAIEHGARKATVANGFISNTESFLYESGLALKNARQKVYEEFDL